VYVCIADVKVAHVQVTVVQIKVSFGIAMSVKFVIV